MIKYKRSEDQLIAVPLPEATDSYVPVPNATIINAIKSRIQKENYRYMGAGYRLANNDRVAAGMLAVQPKGFEDSGIVHNISFLNSYDKSRRLKLGSGALILVCANGMFTENLYAGDSHIHTGKVLDMIDPMLDTIFTDLDTRFEALIEQTEILKSTIIPVEALWQIIGNLLLSDVLGPLSITPLKKNLYKDPNFRMLGDGGVMTAWNAYNQITELLKNVPAYRLVSSHVDAHNIVLELLVNAGLLSKDQIVTFSGITDFEDAPTVPENDVIIIDVVESAAEELEHKIEDIGITTEELVKLPDEVIVAITAPEDLEVEARF